MPPLEVYLEQADKLAQEIVNAWATSLKAGKATSLTKRFMDLLDKACRYQTARRFAEFHRKSYVLGEQEATDVQATRQAFAEAYKSWHEEHDRFRQRPD